MKVIILVEVNFDLAVKTSGIVVSDFGEVGVVKHEVILIRRRAEVFEIRQFHILLLVELEIESGGGCVTVAGGGGYKHSVCHVLMRVMVVVV